MVEAWWQRAPEFLSQCRQRVPASVSQRRYRFAFGRLVLDCEDQALLRRFQAIYPEGADDGAAPEPAVQVTCTVRVHDAAPLAAVIFDDPEPLDSYAFCQSMFPDRDYMEGPVGADGWRTITTRQNPAEPQVALHDNHAVVDRRQVWQPFIANYAMNRVLRLQRELLFFHAASIGFEGRGVLMVGPKASGKTTTALALAARGQDFLGDEVAVIHRQTKAMLPFRRAVSIRPGPRARRVREHLTRCQYPVEKFPDGGERTVVNLAGMFPEAGASPATLSYVLFLRRFAPRPAVEPFAFTLEHFKMISPLACSMWGVPVGARVMDLSRLLRGVRCYYLDPGEPDETADLVERITSGRGLH
jgi:hypothetical protein